MAQKGCDELITDVQARCHRVDDNVLVTTLSITEWLNDAQRQIAERIPNLPELEMRNVSSVSCVTTKQSYNLAEWTSPLTDVTTCNRVCYIKDLYFLNAMCSHRVKFLTQDQFDEKRIDFTNSDYETIYPNWWTRRGNLLDTFPLTDSTWSGYSLRLDGWVYPPDFIYGSSCESYLVNCDEILIRYATAQGWAIIGTDEGDRNYGKWMGLFEDALEVRRLSVGRLTQWDGNMYGEEING
jgi:hypothetical protein